jgi:hypothetical protein
VAPDFNALVLTRLGSSANRRAIASRCSGDNGLSDSADYRGLGGERAMENPKREER